MADVELLPLPEPVVVAEELEFGAIYAYERRHMDAYARANMEPLRAEVERLEDESQTRLEACGDAVSALCTAEARAERLAEALRKYGQHDDTCGVNTFGQIRCTCGFSAALAQEDCNG